MYVCKWRWASFTDDRMHLANWHHSTHSKHCTMMVPGFTKSSSNVSRAHYQEERGGSTFKGCTCYVHTYTLHVVWLWILHGRLPRIIPDDDEMIVRSGLCEFHRGSDSSILLTRVACFIITGCCMTNKCPMKIRTWLTCEHFSIMYVSKLAMIQCSGEMEKEKQNYCYLFHAPYGINAFCPNIWQGGWLQQTQW